MCAAAAPVDLSSPESFQRGFPHEFLAWLRANAPVWWHEPTRATPDGEGFWVVSRHADVVAVMKDPETFASGPAGGRPHGGTAIGDMKNSETMINGSDGARHRALRGIVNKGFTPRAIEALEPEIRARSVALFEGCPAAAAFDFVERFARELPLQMICSVLGVPQRDRVELGDWMDQGIAAPSRAIIAPEFLHKLRDYAVRLIEAKRARPADDILSVIVHAEVDGARLADRELLGFFELLFPAGAETTRSAIAGALLAFAERPDQYELLRRSPALVDSAVEEIVRWTTPSVYKRRTATRRCEIADQQIEPGQKVTVWEMSANRDERAFERPFDFDVRRSPNKHVGFGVGVHFCLGATLARLELRVFLEEIAKRYRGFEIVDLEWMPNARLFGLRRLVVRTAAAN